MVVDAFGSVEVRGEDVPAVARVQSDSCIVHDSIERGRLGRGREFVFGFLGGIDDGGFVTGVEGDVFDGSLAGWCGVDEGGNLFGGSATLFRIAGGQEDVAVVFDGELLAHCESYSLVSSCY